MVGGFSDNVWEQVGSQEGCQQRSFEGSLACEARHFVSITHVQRPHWVPCSRLEANGSGTTKLLPLRPVCVLNGQLDLEAAEIRQLM